jgi:hypothetical protein
VGMTLLISIARRDGPWIERYGWRLVGLEEKERILTDLISRSPKSYLH